MWLDKKDFPANHAMMFLAITQISPESNNKKAG
jgi:hypothetical protein